MKKLSYIFLIVTLSLLNITITKADQLAWITKEQADLAVKFLKTQKEVILFCGCCNSDPKQKVKIMSVSSRHPVMGGEVDEEYYEVVIKAKVNGKVVEIALDLAYVHIKKAEKAYCLGKELNFECDPCTEPFNWAI